MVLQVGRKLEIASTIVKDLSAPIDVTHSASQDVRDDTAQLASWASPDVISPHNTRSKTAQNAAFSFNDAIEEVSETASPGSLASSQKSPRTSTLSEMLRNSPDTEQHSNQQGDDTSSNSESMRPASVINGIISQPTEDTKLLLTRAVHMSSNRHRYGGIKDLENQNTFPIGPANTFQQHFAHLRENSAKLGRSIASPKSWDKRRLWVCAFLILYGSVLSSSFIIILISSTVILRENFGR